MEIKSISSGPKKQFPILHLTMELLRFFRRLGGGVLN